MVCHPSWVQDQLREGLWLDLSKARYSYYQILLEWLGTKKKLEYKMHWKLVYFNLHKNLTLLSFGKHISMNHPLKFNLLVFESSNMYKKCLSSHRSYFHQLQVILTAQRPKHLHNLITALHLCKQYRQLLQNLILKNKCIQF